MLHYKLHSFVICIPHYDVLTKGVGLTSSFSYTVLLLLLWHIARSHLATSADVNRSLNQTEFLMNFGQIFTILTFFQQISVNLPNTSGDLFEPIGVSLIILFLSLPLSILPSLVVFSTPSSTHVAYSKYGSFCLLINTSREQSAFIWFFLQSVGLYSQLFTYWRRVSSFCCSSTIISSFWSSMLQLKKVALTNFIFVDIEMSFSFKI